jgi:hypothetical protein
MPEFNDLIITQLNRLEDKLNKLEDFLIYSDTGFQAVSIKLNQVDNSTHDLYSRVLEIESKIAKIEYRISRQNENAELRQFIEFIHGFPLGWTGLWWTFVIIVAFIDILLDWTSLPKILSKFFGLD